MTLLINQLFTEAARSNQLDELKNLLSQGADIHVNNDEALRLSAENGHLEIVKILLAQGANVHANNDEALKEAKFRKHYDVWQVLSAFIQEEKLLVAASESMLVLPELGSVALVAAVGSTSASSWVCGMLQTPQVKIKKSLRSKI